jgi:hypothetical protein
MLLMPLQEARVVQEVGAALKIAEAPLVVLVTLLRQALLKVVMVVTVQVQMDQVAVVEHLLRVQMLQPTAEEMVAMEPLLQFLALQQPMLVEAAVVLEQVLQQERVVQVVAVLEV